MVKIKIINENNETTLFVANRYMHTKYVEQKFNAITNKNTTKHATIAFLIICID